MVQPLLRRLTGAVLFAVASSSSAAAAGAEELPAGCRGGLVVGLPDADGQDIVAAVCDASRATGARGLVRVSVVGGARVRVVAARSIDARGREDVARIEVASVDDAIAAAPALVASLDRRSEPGPPSPATKTTIAARTTTAASSSEADAPPLQTKAGPPAAMVGVHAGTAFAARGASALGGGASLGVDHRSAEGFVDFLYANGALGRRSLEALALAMGARVKLAPRAFAVPVLGGGWSYTAYDAREAPLTRKAAGIGVFGEVGLILPRGRHRVTAVGRLNLGMYGERVTDEEHGYSAGGRGALTPSYALLVGYAYVFR